MKPAVVQTLSNLEDHDDIEFSSSEWKTIEKVIRVLEPFEEATKALSKHEAAISIAIPYVTSLIKSLEEEAQADYGVWTVRRNFREAMITRFSEMEENESYAIATLLDSRFKHHMFRDTRIIPRIKGLIVDQIVSDLRENLRENTVQVSQKLVNSDIFLT